MKTRSLFYTLIFVALLSISTILSLFLYFLKNDYEEHINTMFNRYQIIRSILLHTRNTLSDFEFDRYLRQFNMSIVFNRYEKSEILRHAVLLKKDRRRLITETLRPTPTPFIARKEIELDISLNEYKDLYYFYMRTPLGDLLIHDGAIKPYKLSARIFLIIAIMFILMVSFLFMLLKIYPLREISQALSKLGKGDLSARLSFTGNNELVEIADSFNKTAEQLSHLIEGRTLFMRNVMHELKTPIAKGRILAAMVSDEQQKKRFTSLFVRMQKLIDDFALLDQVKSKVNVSLEESYNVLDLIDEAIEIGFFDHNDIEVIEKVRQRIYVDFNLFTIVIKNMIDNGIKYSRDSKITIELYRDKMLFISKGEALKEPLEYYLEAFSGEKREGSFGLGLYIVHTILKLHHMSMHYYAQNGQNYFEIHYQKTE